LDEIGLEKGLMKSVARLKLQYFGYLVRGSADELSLAILEGAVNGTRHQGAPRMSWIHNVLKWSGKTYGELKALAQDRKKCWMLSWEFSSAAELLQRRRRPKKRM